MFINVKELIDKLNTLPINNIPEHVHLIFDITGFSFHGSNPKETKELNRRWRYWLSSLNEIVGIEEYLTIPQIAKHLQVSNNTIYKIIKEQDKKNPILPFIDTGKGIKIKTSDYFNFLEKSYYPSYLDDIENIRNPL